MPEELPLRAVPAPPAAGPGSRPADPSAAGSSPHRGAWPGLEKGAVGAAPTERPDDWDTLLHPRTALEPGMRVQHYELIRELGEGGMGQVFLARDLRLGRRVAIKFLTLRAREYAERFLAEARATANCTHDNIVVIHDMSEHDGVPFMVLEYLEGETLKAHAHGRRLPPTRAVELIVPVVRALVCAHAADIVHRDLKPENVLVLASGAVKVLDFGIAKLAASVEPELPGGATLPIPVDGATGISGSPHTRHGVLVGTLRYMSPEQWRTSADVDGRADIWAAGLMLLELVSGAHPYADLRPEEARLLVAPPDRPMPRALDVAPHVPPELAAVIDRCLAKRKEDRFPSAAELLQALLPLLPGRQAQVLADDECPFLGLTPFQEADAGRFFGREADTTRAVARLRELPLVGVAGPSGVGKSSFVRAGVMPALRRSGERWECFVTRPGRSPLASLARLLQPITQFSGINATGPHGGTEAPETEHALDALVQRLRAEPGYLGTLLRGLARRHDASVLLIVDQFEELYTQVPDAAERHAYVACLQGAADDASAPLRVLVTMRSDFLDRVAESQDFAAELTRGLILLQAPDAGGLREALTRPLTLVGHTFETEDLVDTMLEALAGSPSVLPLLQFSAMKLWEARDRNRRVLTEQSYLAMGGIAGALATHADAVLGALSSADQRLVADVFLRLVSADGTRALVDVAELADRADAPAGEVRRLIDYLVQARLLAVQQRGDAEGPAVEIVHESLILSWPTLRRWLEKGQEDAAFRELLRNAARQWEAKGRPEGLLWTGDAVEEARLWARRHHGEVARGQREYLDAVLHVADRATRRRRVAVAAAFVVLIALIVVGAVALVRIRQTEQHAREQAAIARSAERRIKDQLERVQRAERERAEADRRAARARAQAESGRRALATTQDELKMSHAELRAALQLAREESARATAEKHRAVAERTRAEAERTRAEGAGRLAREAAAQAEVARLAAEKATVAERDAKRNLERLLAREQARVKKLLHERRKITTDLD